MRLPDLPPPLPPAAENLYEIKERPPVTPAPKTRPRTLPPLVLQRRRARRQNAEDSSGQDGAAAQDAQPSQAIPEHRMGERRHVQRYILLDTRSGHERRQVQQGTAATGVDILA